MVGPATRVVSRQILLVASGHGALVVVSHLDRVGLGSDEVSPRGELGAPDGNLVPSLAARGFPSYS